MGTPQAAILAPVGRSGYSIELDFQSGDALAAIDRILERLPQDRGVFGLGAAFARKLGLVILGYFCPATKDGRPDVRALLAR